jgi:hypothetical protein
MLLDLANSVNADQAVSVPAGWLLEALGDAPSSDSSITADLTLQQVADLFGRKSSSTVRLWCEKGYLPGSYRLAGREWRVPQSAIAAFQGKQSADAKRLRPDPTPAGETGNLGDWRKHRQGAA